MDEEKDLTAEKDFYKLATARLEKRLELRNIVYEELLADHRAGVRIDRWWWRCLFPIAILCNVATATFAGLAIWRFW